MSMPQRALGGAVEWTYSHLEENFSRSSHSPRRTDMIRLQALFRFCTEEIDL